MNLINFFYIFDMFLRAYYAIGGYFQDTLEEEKKLTIKEEEKPRIVIFFLVEPVSSSSENSGTVEYSDCGLKATGCTKYAGHAGQVQRKFQMSIVTLKFNQMSSVQNYNRGKCPA